MDDLVECFRPTGQKELDLVAASGYTRWPPRLPDQDIFYPVTNESYAIAFNAMERNGFRCGLRYSILGQEGFYGSISRSAGRRRRSDRVVDSYDGAA